MHRLTRRTLLTISSLLFAGAAAGCGGQSKPVAGEEKSADATPVVSNDPITLTIFTSQNSVYADDSGFQDQVGKYIKQKFPNITVQHIHKGKGQDYPDLIAAGTIPDIILESSQNNVNDKIIANGLQFDISDLIKKYKFDLNRIDPMVVKQIQNSNPGRKMLGLPFTVSSFVMYYNKDIFDKFGVPYPKDGMTYDQIYELAKKMTRTDGDVSYIGYSVHPGLMMAYNQLSLSPLSLTEDKAVISTDAWKKLFNNFLRIYQIPGNQYTSVDDFPKGQIAMATHVAEKVSSWYTQNPSLNFDLASAPSFADIPNTGLQPNTYTWFITQQSKYKDQAFQVISYLLSDEVQSNLSKEGVVTPLISKDIHLLFGQDLPQLKGKNTQALFFNKYASPPEPRAANLVSYNVNTAGVFDLVMKSGNDLNTAIKTVEEDADQKIADLKSTSTK